MQFMQQNAVYIFIALLIGWFLWQRVIGPKMSGVKSLSAADYMQMRNQSHTLVDVRQQHEWDAVHAANAVHIPLGEIKERMHEIQKEKPVVVICASGGRSSMAATALANAGYEEVYNFSGGMGAWSSAGLPVRSRG
ncbi:Rhodanese-related sulfurtransferase [Mariprofundus ferrinatatus]|uniref:Rhodanese-related sulfurtransferase n=1 Tax=Mariprofundus ferrinatatus TaxID=1921087 RepID=A0A2K8L7C0_9PROT|nr:rhodanese-like domain-containing protein [Mariprofundus ferrinatatus]ATX82149.1 Rhodanese-related sulfurtransferase [Mariprofundus ferrinatatus]